jgi:hypothetical protein
MVPAPDAENSGTLSDTGVLELLRATAAEAALAYEAKLRIVTFAVAAPEAACKVQKDPAGGLVAGGAVYVDVNVPSAKVVPPKGLYDPHVPAMGTMVTSWPDTGAPPLVSVAVNTEFPDGWTAVGFAVKDNTFGAAVWFTVAEPVCAASASVAVMVAAGDATVVDDVYVVVATPLALVTAKTLFTVPAWAPATVNITESPATGVAGAVLVSVTVALMVEVLVPSAGMLPGVAVTATE